MEWTEEAQLQLIELYQSRENLWNPRDKDYYRKNLKMDSWVAIAESMGGGKTWEESKKKILSLLSTYRKERKKVKDGYSTGAGAADIHISYWFAYRAFQFLENRDEPRQRMNTEEEREPELQNLELQAVLPTSSPPPTSSHVSTPSVIATSRPHTERYKKKKGADTLITEAVSMMKTAADVLQKPPSQSQLLSSNEATAFTNFIASKMLQYSDYTRKWVEYDIIDILKRADLGFYNPPQSFSSDTLYSQQPTTTHTPISLSPLPTQSFQITAQQPQLPQFSNWHHQIPSNPSQHTSATPISSLMPSSGSNINSSYILHSQQQMTTHRDTTLPSPSQSSQFRPHHSQHQQQPFTNWQPQTSSNPLKRTSITPIPSPMQSPGSDINSSYTFHSKQKITKHTHPTLSSSPPQSIHFTPQQSQQEQQPFSKWQHQIVSNAHHTNTTPVPSPMQSPGSNNTNSSGTLYSQQLNTQTHTNLSSPSPQSNLSTLQQSQQEQSPQYPSSENLEDFV